MTQAEEHEALIDSLSSEIEGVRWTEDGREASSVSIARAVLAEIAEKAKEWPTEEMTRADAFAYGVWPHTHWRAMLAVSPLVKPEPQKERTDP